MAITIVVMVVVRMTMMVPRTNPTAKQLHCVMVRGTAVDVTGCIILLQFCPKLTKVLFISITLGKLKRHDHHVQGGGRLEHESIGDAIYTLNKKLKVNNIVLKGKSPILLSRRNLYFLLSCKH